MRTPLLSAVLCNQTETAAFLISRGAYTNVRDMYSDTPLMLAAMKGNTEIASLLLDSGADVTAEDFSEPPETAAAKAHRYGKKNIIELLKGASAKHEIE
jgi:ankyrin repeat protein